MPAYMIALNRSVHNRDKLVEYWTAAPATFEGLFIIDGGRCPIEERLLHTQNR